MNDFKSKSEKRARDVAVRSKLKDLEFLVFGFKIFF